VTADKRVKADSAKELGLKILMSMDGNTIREFLFKRKQQVVTLSPMSAIKVDGDLIPADPQLLLQCFLNAANGLYADQSEIFTY